MELDSDLSVEDPLGLVTVLWALETTPSPRPSDQEKLLPSSPRVPVWVIHHPQ